MLPVDEVVKNLLTDTTAFWERVRTTIHYPLPVQDGLCAERVEVMIYFDPQPKSLGGTIKISSSAQNPYFAQSIHKLEYVFKVHTKRDCEAFITTFFVYFDIEPFQYEKLPKPGERYLIENNLLVYRGCLQPFLSRDY